MSKLLNLINLKKQFKKDINNKKHINLMLGAIDNYFQSNEIYYYDEQSNIYISSNIHKYIIKIFKEANIKKYWLPKFEYEEQKIANRYIIEDGEEIEYYSSKYYAMKIEKYGNQNKLITKEEKNRRKQQKKETKENSYQKKVNRETNKFNKNKELFIQELNKKQLIISFDMEFWEKTGNEILELGFSVLDTNTMNIVSKNILIKENIEKINGVYVPNNKNNFDYGETLCLPEEEAWKLFNSYLNKSNVYLGHDLRNDLERLDDNTPIKKYCDTIKMFNHYDYGYKYPINLEKILTFLNIEHRYLHNAGNDAYYTLQSALKMVA